MAITLDQFRTISNGSYNVGQIKLNDDENGLERINNHVWKTSQNNVQTSAADNQKVRQALVEAFKADARVPEALKGQIEYILLGEGRATRSLGRDFVKKLITTATDANNAVGNIVSAMETVEKRLLDRSVTRMTKPNDVPRDLMTSTGDVSFEIYASEAMDRAAVKAHDGFVKISRSLGGDVVNVAEGAMETFRGISEMLQRDRRLVDNPNVLPLCDDIREMSRTFFVDNRTVIQSLYGRDKAAVLFERKVRELYAKHKIPEDVCNDHFARVFARSSSITDGAEDLRMLFNDVSTGLIYGFEADADKVNLGRLYLKFVDAMIGTVQTDDSLDHNDKTIVLDRLNALKGTLLQPSARLTEFTGLGDKAFNESNGDHHGTLAEMVEAHLLKDIRDAFMGVSDAEFRAFQRMQALVQLGLGV